MKLKPFEKCSCRQLAKDHGWVDVMVDLREVDEHKYSKPFEAKCRHWPGNTQLIFVANQGSSTAYPDTLILVT